MDKEASAPGSYGMARQMEIYQGAIWGQSPALPLAPEALEARAQERLPPEAFDYVAGGAGAEETMRANREAFRKWRIVPRMLRDVSRRDLRVRLFDAEIAAPVLLAPVGVQGIVHPDGEPASARAAAAAGIPFIHSTAASTPLEQAAAALAGSPGWYQLYWSADSAVCASMVARAEKAGCQAIVVTLDTPMLGWRERDLQRAYLPFLTGSGLANYFADPAFRAALQHSPEEDPVAAVRHFFAIYSNPKLTWDDLKFLRDRTRLPLLLKGIMHPDDACRAVDGGVDGIVVSNHGGRQVDGGIGALDALPAVVEAVSDRLPVLFDSGIRRGADAVKALALGAKAVLLGRPYIWGLALAGEQGVREVVSNFLADLDLTLGLSGFTSCDALDRSALQFVGDAVPRA